MGMECNSDIIAGAYQPEIVTFEIQQETVTRYNEETGRPYKKVIEEEKFRIGHHALDDLSEAFEYLEDKLDRAGGYWDKGDDDDENPNMVWGIRLKKEKDGSFSPEAVSNLLVEVKQRFLELGIEVEPKLYHITEMVD